MENEQTALTGAQETDATENEAEYTAFDDIFAEDMGSNATQTRDENDDFIESEDENNGIGDKPNADTREDEPNRQSEDAESNLEKLEKGETQKKENQQMIPLKFYGKTEEKPLNEVVILAQKGMDYDNVREKLEAAEPAMVLMEECARESDMTLAEYTEMLRMQLRDLSVANAQKTGDLPADVPPEIAGELLQYRKREAQRAEDEKERAENEKQQNANRDGFMALLKEYPALQGGGDLPQEVMTRITGGETPLSAYRAYENARLKAQLAAKEAETKNKAAVPGSAGGISNQNTDPFSDGFDTGFN